MNGNRGRDHNKQGAGILHSAKASVFAFPAVGSQLRGLALTSWFTLHTARRVQG